MCYRCIEIIINFDDRDDKMFNVLVLGISGNVSQGILKAIRQSNMECRIIGACVNVNTVGDLWCDAVYESPYANSVAFIPWLVELCNKENISILLTGVEENLLAISQNIEVLKKETRTVFIVSEYEKLLIGQDKFLTCEWLKKSNFNYPLYVDASNKDEVVALGRTIGYPLIAKPKNGKGSRGVFLIRSEEEAKQVDFRENYVVQQCIGNSDSEYTVGCYMDKKGNSVEPIVMHRWLSNGATWKAEVVNNQKIKEECLRICEAFRPMGPMNIQLRLDENGTPIPFELNIRFSGTTPMRNRFGFCDVVAAIKEYLYDEEIDNCFCIYPGVAYRYINEAYEFFEDEKKSNKSLEIDRTLEEDAK